MVESKPESLNDLPRLVAGAVRLGPSVYDYLLERLISREIAPGSRISVDSLVRELGVSQTPIRDALSQLEAQGLVVKTHLVGFHAAPAFTSKDFEDLYEFRKMIEPISASKAAANMAQGAVIGGFAEYNAKVAESRQHTDPPTFNRFARTDVTFHSIVAKVSGSRFLFDAISASNLQFHLFRQGYNPHWIAEVIDEHDIIMARVLAADPKGAERAMLKHLNNSHSRYKSTRLAAD